MRGILNSGRQRNRPYIRWDAVSRMHEDCPTFAMAALASIGDLPDTIMDRAVVIRMRRRAPSEQVSPYRTRRDRPPLREIGDWLADWSETRLSDLEDAEPDMPVEDRAADTWEPLVAVADLVGGTSKTRPSSAAPCAASKGRQTSARPARGTHDRRRGEPCERALVAPPG